MAKNINIELTKGDTETLLATFYDSNGDAFAITGYVFTFTVGTIEGLSDVISKTGSAFVKSANTASLELSATDTNQVAGQYWYNLSMVDSQSKKTTISHGKCIITLERSGQQNDFFVKVGTTTLDVDMFVAYGTQSGGGGGGISSIDVGTPTTITGLIKGNSGSIEQAISGTDYASATHLHSGVYIPVTGGNFGSNVNSDLSLGFINESTGNSAYSTLYTQNDNDAVGALTVLGSNNSDTLAGFVASNWVILHAYLSSGMLIHTGENVPIVFATNDIERMRISGDGTISFIGNINYLPMDLTPSSVPTTEGTISWNETDKCLNIQSDIVDSILQVGQEQWVRVTNKTGAPLANGTVVYINGAQGNRPTIAKADADNTTADSTIGVLTATINNNAEGYLTTLGVVRSINTTGFSAGDPLFVSSTAGELTNIEPVQPKHATIVAYALNSTVSGSILVDVSKRCDISKLHDVLLSGISNLDILQYDSSTTLWKNTPRPFSALHGFLDRTNSTLSMSTSNFQITTGSSYVFYVNGVKFTKSTTQSVSITDDLDETFVFYDSSGTLQKSTTPWNITSLTEIPIAIIYKDGSNYKIYDERHSYSRCLEFHKWAHLTIGARYGSGLTGTFTNTTLSITQGVIYDEDISNDTNGTKTTATLWYRNTGANAMRFESLQSYPYKQNSGTLQYENAGTLTNASLNRFVNSWVYAVPDTGPTNAQIAIVIGQSQFTTISSARSDSTPVFAGISTLEWKLLYRVTYQNVGGTATFAEAQDYRNVSSGPTSTFSPTDHASLTNRDAINQHPITSISDLNSAIGFVIDGGTSTPTTGAYCLLALPYACTVNSWYIAGDSSGSAAVDILVAGTSIVGAGNKPTLSTAQTASASVSGWTDVNLAQNDLLTVNLDSISTCKRLNIQLRVTRV